MEKLTKPQNIFVKRNRFLSFLWGILLIALAALLAAMCFYLIPFYGVLESIAERVLMYFAGAFFVTACLISAALNFNNMRFECVLYTDENGLYHYSGFLHLGFIDWKDINDFSLLGRFSALADDGPRLRLYPKDATAFWKSLPFIKKFLLGFSHFGIPVRTLFTNVKAQELYPLLKESLRYYTAEQDEREEQ